MSNPEVMKFEEFISKIIRGDIRSISRGLTLIESGSELSEVIVDGISANCGRAHRIGITGPPGAGKSTLTNLIAKQFSSQNKKVGIIAVDPSSPFSGGALLGDRVRMSEVGMDPNVFIRSLATRGSMGGLSVKARDAADLLDAAGYDVIIYETVGVGQSELDIVKAADSVVVILVPESGDSVQAMKSGLMEIADIFVLNKGDRPGAEQSMSNIRSMLMMKFEHAVKWEIPVLKTIASEAYGITKLCDSLTAHYEYLLSTNKLYSNRAKYFNERVEEIVRNKILENIMDSSGYFHNRSENSNDEAVPTLSPYQAAINLIEKIKNSLTQK